MLIYSEERELLAGAALAAVPHAAAPGARPRAAAGLRGAAADLRGAAAARAAAAAPHALGQQVTAPDAIPLREVADLGRDPRPVLLAGVRAASVQLGVAGHQRRVRLPEPAQEPLARARPQVQHDRGDVRRARGGRLPDGRLEL